jgi:phosphoadenylyl-sulfate reductase (thioredoxin)
VRNRYGITVEVYFPRAEAVEAMVREHGLDLFYDSVDLRQMCCGVRKVEPLERALAGLDAWITGLRPSQSVTRGDVRAVEVDDVHGGRIKLNPLVGWSREQVMDYVETHHVPINPLHAQGYPSVGCVPCTRSIQPGEDERAGRWWWESADTRECGIHVGYEEKGSGI